MIVSLTGFMGSGKTSVGRYLSTLIQYDFLDLDDYIVNDQQRPIPEIFATEGEAAFRKIERDCLEKVLDDYESNGRSLILSLGGGAVTTPECLKMVQDRTQCIYLKGSASTIRTHLLGGRSIEEAAKTRPLLAGNGIEDMMEKRSPIYEAAAHKVLLIDGRNVPTLAHKIQEYLSI